MGLWEHLLNTLGPIAAGPVDTSDPGALIRKRAAQTLLANVEGRVGISPEQGSPSKRLPNIPLASGAVATLLNDMGVGMEAAGRAWEVTKGLGAAGIGATAPDELQRFYREHPEQASTPDRALWAFEQTPGPPIIKALAAQDVYQREHPGQNLYLDLSPINPLNQAAHIGQIGRLLQGGEVARVAKLAPTAYEGAAPLIGKGLQLAERAINAPVAPLGGLMQAKRLLDRGREAQATARAAEALSRPAADLPFGARGMKEELPPLPPLADVGPVGVPEGVSIFPSETQARRTAAAAARTRAASQEAADAAAGSLPFGARGAKAELDPEQYRERLARSLAGDINFAGAGVSPEQIGRAGDAASLERVTPGSGPAQLLAGNAHLRSALAGALAGGAGESLKTQDDSGQWRDPLGNPTSAPDVLAGGLRGAAVAGGASLGAAGIRRAPVLAEIGRGLGQAGQDAAGRVLNVLGWTGQDLREAGGEFRQAMAQQREARALNISTKEQAAAAGSPVYVKGTTGPVDAWRNFWQTVRTRTITHPKNALLDVAHTRGMLREFGSWAGDPASVADRVQDELRANRDAPTQFGKQSDTLQGLSRALLNRDYVPDLGVGMLGEGATGEAERILPEGERIAYGVAASLGRTRGLVSLIGAVGGGALYGKFEPGIRAFFRRVNNLPQRAGRESLMTLTVEANSWDAARDFLDRAASDGQDVTALAGRLFSPDEAARALGPEWGRAWSEVQAGIWGGAETEVKRIFGDFRQPTMLEQVPLLGRALWLASWTQRMAPVYLAAAARHSGATVAAVGALGEQASHLKERGLPPWALGGIDTPLGRVSLPSVLPFTPEPVGQIASDEDRNAYQTATDVAGAAGIPLHPGIGTVAYVAGLDPRRPGDMGRWSGLESLVPGPQLDQPYGAMLDKARQIVTGLGAGDLAAGKKAPASEADKEFARLVFDRTGLPLADPRNIGAVIDSLADDPDTPAARWRKEAEANVAGRQGKQGVVSAVSPLTISRIDPLQRAAAIGRTNQPYSYEQISAAYDAGQKKQAQAMQAANTASKAPNQRVYDSASESQRAGLVKEWLKALERPPVQAGGQPYARLRRR